MAPESAQEPSHAYAPLQLLFLYRLTRLLFQRQRYTQKGSAPDWHLKLIHKAIYSTYCDCVALGIGNDAKHLFEVQYPVK